MLDTLGEGLLCSSVPHFVINGFQDLLVRPESDGTDGLPKRDPLDDLF